MKEILPTLKVHVLGGFSIIYGDKPIACGRNTNSKAMELFQILLYCGEKGIARERLLEELYGRVELANSANSLRVTVHRLKKMLADTELPPYDYIKIKKGIYQCDMPMAIEVDAWVFMELIESAKEETDEKQMIKLLTEACQMYGGDFLPSLSRVGWALVEGIYYKELYAKTLKKICDWHMSRDEYTEALQLCAPACAMYPFDDWQVIRIDCFIGLKQYKDAMREYENTAKLYLEELGVSPSEKMMEQLEIISRRINYKSQEIKHIKNRLQEKDESQGAYYCSLPGFRDNYRLVSRIIESNGESACLMLCNIINGKGQPLENPKKLEIISHELYNTIKHCLKRDCAFTKYSSSQYLVLLMGVDRESCNVIYDRINNCFSRKYKTWAQHLEFDVSSLTEVNQLKLRI